MVHLNKKWCFILWMLTIQHIRAVEILRNTINRYGPDRESGGATLLNPKQLEDDLEGMTVCIRFNLIAFYSIPGIEQSRILTLGHWQLRDTLLLWLNVGADTSFFGFGSPNYATYLLENTPEEAKKKGSKYDLWAPNKWESVCISFNTTTKHLRVTRNGYTTNLNFEDTKNLNNTVVPKDVLSMIHVGRCNNDYEKNCDCPNGKFTDINFWSRDIGNDNMEKWTACKYEGDKPDLLDWSNSTWNMTNMVKERIEDIDLCKPLRPGNVFFPEPRNFTSMISLCKKMRAKVTVVENENIQNELLEKFNKQNNSTVVAFWNGWWEINEGTFVNANTNEELGEYQPWNFGEPNGGELENCIGTYSLIKNWIDLSCSFNDFSLGFCQFDGYPLFSMRGLCEKSNFDHKFSWNAEMINGRYCFRGFSNSLIFWEDEMKQWKFVDFADNQMNSAVTRGKEYPFGRKNWLFEKNPCKNDEEDYDPMSPRAMQLNLNSCNAEEFNCADGGCVKMENRCDGKPDCEDRSDEIHCSKIMIDNSYLMEFPAPSNESQVKSEIQVSCEIQSVLEISEVKSHIELQFELIMKWRDSRLKFLNLKDNSHSNMLTHEKEQIWIPEIIFYNTNRKDESLNDRKTLIEISKEGRPKKSSTTAINNEQIFDSNDNPIVQKRVYDIEFICNFNMENYPFDIQTCNVELKMKENSENFAKLTIGELNYTGPIDLTQYFVQSWMMKNGVNSDEDGLTIEIIFGRKILSQILTTYIPTILICMVSFSTNYYKSQFFEANVAVNLTSLLVLTTIFISVSVPPI